MELTSAQMDILSRHLELVIEMNRTMNLTRIETIDQGRVLHIEDSLSALQEVNAAPLGLYADLGSGAGYPGIPLAVVTGRETVLVEARKKKTEALREMIETLKLNNVDVFTGRAELLARDQRNAFSVITARALAKLSVLLELGSPLLQLGGILVCYKANIEREEYLNAKRVCDLTGMKQVSDRSLTLSDEITSRRIVCFEKVAEPKAKLPRQEGFAQKKPL